MKNKVKQDREAYIEYTRVGSEKGLTGDSWPFSYASHASPVPEPRRPQQQTGPLMRISVHTYGHSCSLVGGGSAHPRLLIFPVILAPARGSSSARRASSAAGLLASWPGSSLWRTGARSREGGQSRPERGPAREPSRAVLAGGGQLSSVRGHKSEMSAATADDKAIGEPSAGRRRRHSPRARE